MSDNKARSYHRTCSTFGRIHISSIPARLKVFGDYFVWLEKYFGRYETILAILILFAIASATSPVFLTSRNLINILMHVTVIGIVSMAMTFVISMGGIDLSVGSVLAFSSVCATTLLKQNFPVVLSVLIGLATGAFIGAINGLLAVYGRLPPFIATLGMMGIARGAALIVAQGRSIYGFPAAFLALGQKYIAGFFPMPAFIFLVVTALSYYVFFMTKFGHYTVIIGDNEEAAYSVGINVKRIKFINYILSGSAAALGGILFAARLNAAEPTAGVGYELDAIASVVIGGTNLFGGRGTVLGTFLGVLFVGLVRNILNLLAVSPYYQQLAVGGILIGAVLLDNLRLKEKSRK